MGFGLTPWPPDAKGPLERVALLAALRMAFLACLHVAFLASSLLLRQPQH